MTRAPFVRAVVLNWNGGDHVVRSVSALLATDWPVDRLAVVVVDNASTDGSDRLVESTFPSVELRRSTSNVGFPGNNLAMTDLVGVDYVALINNDAFVTPSWLAPLVDALEADSSLGAASPKLVFAPRFTEVALTCATVRRPLGGRDLGVRLSGLEVAGVDRWTLAQFGSGFWGEEAGPRGGEERFRWTAGVARLGVPLWEGPEAPPVTVRLRLAADAPAVVTVGAGSAPVELAVGRTPAWFEFVANAPSYDVVQNAGSMVLEGGYGADRGFGQRDDERFADPAEVFAWCGGGVLLRAEFLRRVGLFEPRFFMYYEDTDLAWRGRAQGWRYRYVPASVVRHLHAASSGEGSALFQHYVERNRLVMLTRNAPASMAAGAVGRYVLTLASLVRADLASAVARRRPPRLVTPYRRAKSFAGYLRWLPRLLMDRRRLRNAAVVGDAEMLHWVQPRSVHPF